MAGQDHSITSVPAPEPSVLSELWSEFKATISHPTAFASDPVAFVLYAWVCSIACLAVFFGALILVSTAVHFFTSL